MVREFDAIIFDLDGVICYTDEYHYRAWKAIADNNGIPFDPLDRADPDTTLPAEKRPIGGLGILMVKKMMDKVTYRRENGCNILTIQKSTE